MPRLPTSHSSLRTLLVSGYAVVVTSILCACSGGGSAAPNAMFPASQGAPASVQSHFAQSEIEVARPPAYRKVVLNTKPLADFPFDSASEGSLVGGYTTTLVGGAKIVKGGPIQHEKNYHSLKLAGMQYVTTSLNGGIPGTGSMVAWVNLSELPSTAGTYFYVAGESQSGNDFDLQFENDNNLYFYTGSGENTVYTPPANSLVGHWNMIAVTYQGGSNGFRNIYWNGALAAPFTGGVDANSKTAQFSVGESTVFGGRYFQGSIAEVGVWNRALTAKEIATIYKAAR